MITMVDPRDTNPSFETTCGLYTGPSTEYNNKVLHVTFYHHARFRPMATIPGVPSTRGNGCPELSVGCGRNLT